jgi:hypothetical protein
MLMNRLQGTVSIAMLLFASSSPAAEITPPGSSVTASTQDGNVPGNTVDGSLSTRWSGNGSGAWIRFDLGTTLIVSDIRVAVHQGNARRNSFDLQLSTDNVSWVTVFSGQSSGNTTQEEMYDFADQSARYVRYVGRGATLNAGGTSSWNSVSEVSLFGSGATATPTPTPRSAPTATPSPTITPTPAGTPNTYIEVTPPASAVSASTSDGNVPGNTVDNSLSTRWSGNGDGAWIRYDLGTTRTVGHVSIAVYNGNARRNRFDLQVSSDGINWTAAVSNALTSGTTTLEQVQDFADVQARYVRYVGHGATLNAGGTSTFNSVTELSIFATGTATPTPTPRAVPTATPTPSTTPTPSAGAPAKPTIRVETVSPTSYNVIWDKWSGNDATSGRLYENDQLIHTEALASTGGAHQGAVYTVTGKTYGVYAYRVVLTNASGSTSSDLASIVVGGASRITIAPADGTGQALQLTVSQGTTDFSLGMSGAAGPSFTLQTSNGSVMACQLVNGTTLRIAATRAGRSALKITETTTGEVRYVGVRIRTAAGALPKMPEYVSVGSVSEDTTADLDFWRAYAGDLRNRRMDIRYIYINGGPINGWRNWAGVEGGRAITFVRESLKMGMIPFFVYYNIPDGSESYDLDRTHINDPTYMSAYFKDLKFFLDIVKREAGDELVGVVFEPDFIGYMMQNSGGKSPIPADQLSARTDAAYSSGVLISGSDPAFPNTIAGLVNAINYATKKYASNAYFGWQVNLWASPGVTTAIPSNGLMRKTDTEGISAGRSGIASETQAIANYYLNAGIKSQGAQFVSIDKCGLDAGSTAPSDPAQSPWFWHADHWNNYLVFTRTLGDTTGLPVVLWQIPVGHVNTTQAANPYGGSFPMLDDTATHYEDSAPTFFLGDVFKPGSSRFNYFRTNLGGDAKVSSNGTDTVTWGGHMAEAKANRVISVLFGAGVGVSTDGVGSPATDGNWWIAQVQKYLQSPVPLP